MVIGGRDIAGASTFQVRSPHDHGLHLATVQAADASHVTAAIDAAAAAAPGWASTPLVDRRRSSCGRPTCWPARGVTG